jgi:glycosyltransferase involved in cell wall biosynthesis
MACGNAVIVLDAVGISEQFGLGAEVRIFPAGNADALAQRTIDLCEKPEQITLLGQLARDRVTAEYSSETIYKKNMVLYEKTITHHAVHVR